MRPEPKCDHLKANDEPPGEGGWAVPNVKFRFCQCPKEQEYWSGLPFPSPGNLPDPGIKPGSPALQADSLPSEPPGKSILCM